MSVDAVGFSELTLINDEHLGAHPALHRLPVTLDLAHELGGGLQGKTCTAKRVQCDAANVACSDTSRSSDRDGVLRLGVLALQVLDNLAKENRLARTCMGKQRNDEFFDPPAEPVKKMFLPSWTTSCRTFCCSPLSTSFCLMLMEGPATLFCLSADTVEVELERLLPVSATFLAELKCQHTGNVLGAGWRPRRGELAGAKLPARVNRNLDRARYLEGRHGGKAPREDTEGRPHTHLNSLSQGRARFLAGLPAGREGSSVLGAGRRGTELDEVVTRDDDEPLL